MLPASGNIGAQCRHAAVILYVTAPGPGLIRRRITDGEYPPRLPQFVWHIGGEDAATGNTFRFTSGLIFRADVFKRACGGGPKAWHFQLLSVDFGSRLVVVRRFEAGFP